MLTIYELKLRGGGGDLACAMCLPEAKREHGESVTGIARTDISDGEHCAWCGCASDEDIALLVAAKSGVSAESVRRALVAADQRTESGDTGGHEPRWPSSETVRETR